MALAETALKPTQLHSCILPNQEAASSVRGAGRWSQNFRGGRLLVATKAKKGKALATPQPKTAAPFTFAESTLQLYEPTYFCSS